MIRSALLLLLVLTSASAQAQDDPAAQALRTWFDPLVETRDASGIIAVRREGRDDVFIALGFADWETGATFSAGTQIPAGGLTRGMTHGLVLGLIARGELALDDTVAGFIPEWRGAELLTIGHVLDGTAGLPETWPAGAPASGRSHELVGWLTANITPVAGAHEARASEVGDAILALIIERIMGGRFETLTSARILGPLDMNDSRVVRGPADVEPVLYWPGPSPIELMPAPPRASRLGRAGLTSTPGDLLDWGAAVAARRIDLFDDQSRVHGGFEGRVIGANSVYTAAFAERGFATGIAVVPADGITIAWFINIDSYPVTSLGDVIPRLVLGDTVAPAPVRGQAYQLRDDLTAAAGHYAGSGGEAFRLERRDQTLWLLGPGRMEAGRFVIGVNGSERVLMPTAGAALLERRAFTLYRIETSETGWVTGLDAVTTAMDGTTGEIRLERLDAQPEATDTAPGQAPD